MSAFFMYILIFGFIGQGAKHALPHPVHHLRRSVGDVRSKRLVK